MFEKLKNFAGIDEDYDYDDYEDEEEKNDTEESGYKSSFNKEDEKVFKTYSSSDYSTNSYNGDRQTRRSTGNIVSMNSSKPTGAKISIQEPLEYDDAPNIVDEIKNNKIVILNLEMIEVDKKRQIFDFVNGSIYALNGKIKKVTKDIFVICPEGIEIEGEVSDQLKFGEMYKL